MSWPAFKHADQSSFLQIDLAGVAACLLLSGVAYFVAVRPLIAIREERAAQAQSLRAAMDQANSLVTGARGLRTQLTNAQQALSKLEITLRPATSINERVAEFTSLAGECHVEVQAIQPGSMISSVRFGQIPIQISASATYRDTAEFLHRLRAQFPDTAVRIFELAVQPDDATAVANFNVQLMWYVQPVAADTKQR